MIMWAMASVVVPMWGAAGTMSMMTASVALGLVAFSVLGVLVASLQLAQCSEMIIASACVALLTFNRTLGILMGVPILHAAMFG